MSIRFTSILLVATFLSLFAVPSGAYKIPQYKRLKSVEGLLLKTIGFKPQGIRYYTRYNGTVRTFDAVTGHEFMTFNIPESNGVTSISLISPTTKGSLFGLAGIKSCYVLDPINNATKQTFDDSVILLGDTALSFDEKYFIAMPTWYFVKRRSITVFNFGSGKEEERVTINGSFTSLDVATQSNYLASGDKNSVVWLWPFPSKEVYTLNKHTGPVNSVSFSYDNQFLLSGSSDQTVRLWDVKTQESIKEFKFDEEVEAVQWLPNDNFFAVVSSNDLIIKHIGSGTTVQRQSHALAPQLEPNFVGTLIQFDSTGRYLAIQRKYSTTIQVWEDVNYGK
jgi:WD40 repeat protein